MTPNEIKMFSHTFELKGEINGTSLEGNNTQRQQIEKRLKQSHFDGYYWLNSHGNGVYAPISKIVENFLLIMNENLNYDCGETLDEDGAEEDSLFLWSPYEQGVANILYNKITERLNNDNQLINLVQFCKIWSPLKGDNGHAVSFLFITDDVKEEYHVIFINRGKRFSIDVKYHEASRELENNTAFCFTFKRKDNFLLKLQSWCNLLVTEDRNRLSDILIQLIDKTRPLKNSNEFREWYSSTRNKAAEEMLKFEDQTVGNCSFANTIPGWLFNIAVAYMRENKCGLNEALNKTKGYFELCLQLDQTRQLAKLANSDFSENSDEFQLLTLLIRQWIDKKEKYSKDNIEQIFKMMEWMASDQYPNYEYLKVPANNILNLRQAIWRVSKMLSSEEQKRYVGLFGTVAIPTEESAVAASSTISSNINDRVTFEEFSAVTDEETPVVVLEETDSSEEATHSDEDEQQSLLNTNPREKLKNNLQAYVDRIEGYKKHTNNKFEYNFRFFVTFQAYNREANYYLAKQLIVEIDSEKEISEIFDNNKLSSFRESFFNARKRWWNHGIQSEELKRIIHDAQTLSQ